MANAAAQYRLALEKKLRCGNSAKERLMDGFDQTFAAFLDEHAEPTMDDLTAAFGSPEDMAEVLMAQVSPKEQEQYRSKSLFKKVLAIILVGILVVFTVYIWFVKEFRITATSELYEGTVVQDDAYASPDKEQSP